MNEDAEKLKGFLFRIIDEHKDACRKHPKFCDKIKNEKEQCLEELAQCGAVILRMMEVVDAEA